MMHKLRKLIFPFRLRMIVWVVNRIKQSTGKNDSQNINIFLLALAWGNLGYAGNFVYLRNIAKRAQSSNGYILECGSGVTTILMAAIVSNQKTPLIVLEHNYEWYNYLKKIFHKLNYHHVQLNHMPLHNYGDYTWYSVTKLKLPAKCVELVICDGPPGSTPGGRYGLMPVLSHYLSDNCVVLLDDTHREFERDIIQAWQKYRRMKTKEIGIFGRHTEIIFV